MSAKDITSVSMQQYNADITPSLGDHFRDGFEIYLQGFLEWRIWFYMAFAEIKRRYRRTLFGPFWVTLSIAIFIGTMGVIFPILWHTDVRTYIPFFSSGYIIWSFISLTTTDACNTFVDASGLIKQTSLPFTVYANNVVARNLLVLLHHLPVFIIIMFIFSVPIGINTLKFIPGLLIICLTSTWLCILLGMFTSRFRDIKQIVTSLLQISMFITPIFWEPSQLGDSKARLLVTMNPLYHFIQIARAPLLNQAPSINNWLITIIICILGWLFTLLMLGKNRKHIVFWL